MERWDYRRARALLAEHDISHTAFAAACGLSRNYVSRILHGYPPGELARIHLDRGLARLGLSLAPAASENREPERAAC